MQGFCFFFFEYELILVFFINSEKSLFKLKRFRFVLSGFFEYSIEEDDTVGIGIVQESMRPFSRPVKDKRI